MRKIELQGLLVLILGLVAGCSSSESTTTYAGTGGSGTVTGNTGGKNGTTTSGTGGSSTTTVGTCGAFSACGGTIDGTWQMDGTCISGDMVAGMTPGLNLPSACSGMLTSVTQNVTGTVTFADGIESNNVTATVNETATYTSACMSALSGKNVTMDATLCAQLETSLKDASTGQASTCTFSGGTCNCAITLVTTDTTSSSYTISGHTIIPSGGGDVMDYCVTGTTMKASFVPTDAPGVTIFYTLRKIS